GWPWISSGVGIRESHRSGGCLGFVDACDLDPPPSISEWARGLSTERSCRMMASEVVSPVKELYSSRGEIGQHRTEGRADPELAEDGAGPVMRGGDYQQRQ
ncbi:hypothetical protein FOZ63_022819, partial [Perkinsus olseni]